MILIAAGLLLWAGVHLWQCIASEHQARFGEQGRCVVAIGSAIATAVALNLVSTTQIWLGYNPFG